MEGKHWDIFPNSGIGDFGFGRGRDSIREKLGEPDRIFRKTSKAENTTDVYPSFHVYYSVDEKLEAIEFFGKDITLSLNSQQIYPGTLSAARKVIPDLEESYGSFISRTASIGITAEEDSIESILVGCRDYYKKTDI